MDFFNDIFVHQDNNLLYHYTKKETAIDEILFNGKLRFSPLKEVDDPREVEEWVWKIYNPRLGDGSGSKALDAINRFLRNNCKVLCFSQDLIGIEEIEVSGPSNYWRKKAYEKGFARARMWSQYAEGHKGICFAFSKEKTIDAIKECFKDCFIFHDSVSYMNGSERAIKAQGIDSTQIKIDGINNYFKSYLDEYHNTLFFEKLKDYRDEREYRFVIYNERPEEYEYIDIADILEGVIVGMYFDKKLYRCINKFASAYNFKPRNMSWQQGTPVLQNDIIFKNYEEKGTSLNK
ncbi:MAG: DUF2971 domain-containing protein [Deltaproteobacteria bacterium]|nr:DUF2971 domain-containing protein [Deltaproteobacteria bacterium]